VTGNTDPVAAEPQELFESIPTWLAIASAWAKKNRTCWIFIFDGLNNLNGYRDLQWFPAYLPERIQIVVSCLEGEVKKALEAKGVWDSLFVEPLDPQGQRQLLTEYLKCFNKSLSADLLNQALEHPLANNPLWLKTLAEELRLFGSHEELNNRLNTLLGPPKGKDENVPPTVDDLFDHVLQRIEGDQGRKLVGDALAAILASRAGLSEPELLEILAPHSIKKGRAKKYNKLPPAQWAPVRYALDEMLLESGGRIIFGHDYVRVAVRGRYLSSESLQRNAHKKLAEHFAKRKVDERVAEELPHQWREARAWKQLERTLTNLEIFEAIKIYRSDEEHLGYWLSIEAIKGRQLLEARFKNALKRWNLPSDKEKTADVAGNLVEFFRYAGRGLTGSFAVLLAKKSLDITSKIKGPNHIKTGIRFNTLGGLLYYKGDYEGAEPLFRKSLAIAEKAQGPEHTETGASLNFLGSLLMDKGDYEAAEPLLKRALKINEKIYGKDHVITGNSLNNLGGLLGFKGDYESAERLYRKALAISEKVHGPWHPDTANKLNNVGFLFKVRGNYKRAEPLMRRALAIAEKAQGPDHPATGINLNNLGILLTAIDDYDNAEPLFRRAIAISEKAQGPHHPATGINLSNLGSLLKDKGDFEGAEPLIRRALSIGEKAHGTNHPSTGIYLNKLGLLLRDKGDYESAEPVFMRALAIAENVLGPDHPDTGIRLNNLGRLFHLKGDYDSAEPMLRKAIIILEKILGVEHPSMEICVNNLGLLLHDKGDYESAEQHFKRALFIIKKHKGKKSKSAAEQYKRLGMVLRGSGRYVESREEFHRALEIFEAINTRQSSEVAGVLSEIGQLEALGGNFSEAQKFFAEALEIGREVSPNIVEYTEKLLAAADEGRTL
jgi:tetratricopeptide (TPR) repeat protein